MVPNKTQARTKDIGPERRAAPPEAERPYGFRRLLEAVKNTVTVETVAADAGVELRPFGDRLRASCPVHEGSNSTSFTVSADRERWHCFSCGAGGDVLDLYSKIHKHTDTKLALMGLAASYNVEGPGRPEGWHEWDSEKARRLREIRKVYARSYQRRYFRTFCKAYLSRIEDPEIREAEARAMWADLWPVCWAAAELRLRG